MPSQKSVNKQSPRSCWQIHVWRERIPSGHAVAVDVQDNSRAAVERIVIGREHVTERADIGRKILVVPSVACEKKGTLRAGIGGLEQKSLNPRLPVRKTIPRNERSAAYSGRTPSG